MLYANYTYANKTGKEKKKDAENNSHTGYPPPKCDLSLLALTLVAWRTVTSLTWISSSVKWEQCYLMDPSTSDLRWAFLPLRAPETKAWLRLTHKDRAPTRVGEGFSHSSASFISSSISLIQCQQYPSMSMLGAIAAHCSVPGKLVEGMEGPLPAPSATIWKTGHLPQLTCGHTAPEHVRKSQVVHGFPALGVFPSWCPHFFEPGPGRNNFFFVLKTRYGGQALKIYSNAHSGLRTGKQ